jgi:drug/metabolite transporter (DMT)-like permease
MTIFHYIFGVKPISILSPLRFREFHVIIPAYVEKKRNMNNTIPYLGEVLALTTALVWAFAVILFKKSGEKMRPITLNLFKNALSFLLLIPTIYLTGETIFRDAPGSDYLLLLLSGVLGLGIADILFFKSLNLLGAGLSAIVSCMYSPFIIALSVIFLGDRLTAFQIFGILMILSAVLTASGAGDKHHLARRNLILGILLGILANAATAIGVVIIKPILERSPIFWATEIRLFSGTAVSGLILMLRRDRSLIARPDMNRRQWGFAFLGAFAGAYLSMVLWLGGMKYAQASIAAALNQTSNIFIFLFAALLLREPVTPRRVLGILLGVAGAVLVTFA